MRRIGSEIVERAETIRQANDEAARDPGTVLAALTRNNAPSPSVTLIGFWPGSSGERRRREKRRLRRFLPLS